MFGLTLEDHRNGDVVSQFWTCLISSPFFWAVKEGVGFFDHYITQRVTHQIPSICSIFHSNVIKVPLPKALILWSLRTQSHHSIRFTCFFFWAAHPTLAGDVSLGRRSTYPSTTFKINMYIFWAINKHEETCLQHKKKYVCYIYNMHIYIYICIYSNWIPVTS